MSDDKDLTVWFNPHCSKCRTVQGILAERGIDANYVRYLEQTPSRADLEAVLAKLGTDDPRAIMRTGTVVSGDTPEPPGVYTELGLAGADRDALLDAMVANPILIERPIVIRGDRAVVARPPENVLDLL
jgi:arsenate reductase